MNIILLNPNWNLHDRRYTATIPAPMQPLEYCYIASLLKKSHNVEIYDAHARNATIRETVDHVRDFKADVVVIETAPTYCFWRCCPLDIILPSKICRNIKKETGAKVIVIGPHSTVSPDWVLEETGADCIFRGEPELDIVRFIESGFDKSVQGLYAEGTDNGFSFVADLSKLPLPAFELLDNDRYKPHTWHQEFYNYVKGRKASIMEFTRGCPYNCFFCFKKNFREKFRTKKPDQMIREIRHAKSFGVTFFFFIDEIFNLPTPQLKEFLKKLRKEGIEFSCQCRLDVMNTELLQLMADAGCIHIEWGLESHDKDVLRGMNKDVTINRPVLDLSEKIIRFNIVSDARIYFYTPEVKTILGIDSNRSPLSLKSVSVIPFPHTTLYNEISRMYDLDGKNPWEVAQRFVWYQNLYRCGIRIPFKYILEAPFSLLLHTISSVPCILPSRYVSSVTSGEGRVDKTKLDKLIDKIVFRW